jgi:hypothetical protein
MLYILSIFDKQFSISFDSFFLSNLFEFFSADIFTDKSKLRVKSMRLSEFAFFILKSPILFGSII